MSQMQSILALFILLALAAAPAVWRWARRRDAAPQPASPAPDPLTVEGIMSPRQSLARHLYGEAVGWSRYAMADYDGGNAELEATWLAEADRRLMRLRG